MPDSCDHIHIPQKVRRFSTVDELKDSLKQNALVRYATGRRDCLPFSKDILMPGLSVLLAEPGYGKSHLLDRCFEAAAAEGETVARIRLRQLSQGESLVEALRSVESNRLVEWHHGKGLLPNSDAIIHLDGLDEISDRHVSKLANEIRHLQTDYPIARILLTSRFEFYFRFVGRLSSSVAQLLELQAFDEPDVIAYMDRRCLAPETIDAARSWFHLQRGTEIVRVPRYLVYICDMLKEQAASAAQLPKLSAIFEYVTSKELHHAREQVTALASADMCRRVLAKLALAMEIHQSNSISSEELLTFFDDIDSDLKLAFLDASQFAKFSERLLKFDGYRHEFHNREIQEYLAATEILRFGNPQKALFGLCYDDRTNTLRPSWLNCLRLLFDLAPPLFADVASFLIKSVLLSSVPVATIPEHYWVAAPRYKPGELSKDTSETLFRDIFAYFDATKTWLDYDLASVLATLYTGGLESVITRWREEVSPTDAARRIRMVNLARLVGEIRASSAETPLGSSWLEWLESIVQKSDEDSLVVRTALWAVRRFGSHSTLSKLQNAWNSPDDHVKEGVIQVCKNVCPDDPLSVEYFFQGLDQNVSGAARGLCSIRSPLVQTEVLQHLSSNGPRLRSFLDDAKYSKETLDAFITSLARNGSSDTALQASLDGFLEAALSSVAHSHTPVESLRELGKLALTVCSDLPVKLAKRLAAADELSFEQFQLAHALPYLLFEENYSKVREVLSQSHFNSRDLLSAVEREYKRLSSLGELPRTEAQVTPLHALSDSDFLQMQQCKTPDAAILALAKLHESLPRRARIEISSDNKQLILSMLRTHIFKRHDLANASLAITENGPSARSWTESAFVRLFRLAFILCRKLEICLGTDRSVAVSYIPYAEEEEITWLTESLQQLDASETQRVIDVFFSSNPAYRVLRVSNLLRLAHKLHRASINPIIVGLVDRNELHIGDRLHALRVSSELGITDSVLKDLEYRYRDRHDDQIRISHLANEIRIRRFCSADAIRWRIAEVLRRFAVVPDRPTTGIAFRLEGVEEEVWTKDFAKPLLELSEPQFIQDFIELLEKSLELASNGRDAIPYADYLWGIVVKYFENLLVLRSYEPFFQLEQAARKHLSKENANWFQYSLVKLRAAYANQLGKPPFFRAAVRSLNHIRQSDNRIVSGPLDLTELIVERLSNSVRSWLVGEGEKLVAQAYSASKQREVNLQRLIKMALDLSLNRTDGAHGGFSVIREPQLDNDQKVDLLVSYGFLGPIVIELKLASHADIRTRSNFASTKSYDSFRTYLEGYRCDGGIFLVLENEHITEERFQRVKSACNALKRARCLRVPLFRRVPKQKPKKGARRMTRTKSKGTPRKRVGPSKNRSQGASRKGKAAR